MERTLPLVKGVPFTFVTDGFVGSVGLTSVWESDQIQYVHDLLMSLYGPEGSFTFLDVGANTGSYCFLAKFFPHADFYAFEPVPEIGQALMKTIQLHNLKNLFYVPYAVGDSRSLSTIQLPSDFRNSSGLSTLGKSPLRFSDWSSRIVPITTLDWMFENRTSMKPIAMIKIDTEGFECNVLRGSQNIIRQHKPIIQVEKNDCNAKQCGNESTWLQRFLNEFSYRIERVVLEEAVLFPVHLKKESVQLMQCFNYQGALDINQARIKFLYSLNLPWSGKSVLETGCGGRGDFTKFLLSNQVDDITLNDSRLQNIESLQSTLQRSFSFNTYDLNVDPITESFDAVLSMGTLYHLDKPEFALQQFANATKEFVVIETITNGKEDVSINLEAEDVNTFNQSSTGYGCRPSRSWILATMSKYFKYAYVSTKQPNYQEFPLDWSKPSSFNKRAVFLGVQSDAFNSTISSDVWSPIPLVNQTCDP